MSRVMKMKANETVDGEGHVEAGPLRAGQRWSSRRKREVVVRMLRGEPLDGLSRELAVPVARLEQWRDRALDGIEGALRERGDDPLALEVQALKAKLGDLMMENELLRSKPSGFFVGRRSKR
jgi:hypothetical protein